MIHAVSFLLSAGSSCRALMSWLISSDLLVMLLSSCNSMQDEDWWLAFWSLFSTMILLMFTLIEPKKGFWLVVLFDSLNKIFSLFSGLVHLHLSFAYCFCQIAPSDHLTTSMQSSELQTTCWRCVVTWISIENNVDERINNYNRQSSKSWTDC